MGKLTIGSNLGKSIREPHAASVVETKFITIEKRVEVMVPFETIKEVEKYIVKEVMVPVETIREIIKEVPVEVIREVEKIKEVTLTVEKEVIKEIEKLVAGPVQFVPKLIFKEKIPSLAVLFMGMQTFAIIVLVTLRHL
jgi:hypothetical protein